ncbi:MAG: hypothetical protein Rubg2KO_38550 [Rubricoccaceae bacterium]
MIRVPVALDRTFDLPVGKATAFELLSDIPAWGALYPRVASLDPLPERGVLAWRWRMEPMGPPGFEARITYGCHYTIDPQRHAVTWAPLEGVGNSLFSGAAELMGGANLCSGRLRLKADLEIPAPRFVRPLVQAQVGFEMGRMTDTFIRRVRDELAG